MRCKKVLAIFLGVVILFGPGTVIGAQAAAEEGQTTVSEDAPVQEERSVSGDTPVQEEGAVSGDAPVRPEAPEYEAPVGEEVRILPRGGNPEDGFGYAIPGVGNITSSVEEGGTDGIVFILGESDDMHFQVYRDGVLTGTEDGLYSEEGEYEIRISSIDESRYGVFHFVVTGTELGGLEGLEGLSVSGNSQVEITRNPAMELSYIDGMYVYTLPDGQAIRCNVPLGAATDSVVKYECTEGLTNLVVYRNGKMVEQAEGVLGEPGSYNMTFWDLAVFGEESHAYRIDYSFTIDKAGPKNISYVKTPYGFSLMDARRNGEPLQVEDTEGIFLREDGPYHLMYSSGADTYIYEFERDTKAPALRFTPEFKEGELVKKKVGFEKLDPESEITIYRNGDLVSAPGNIIVVNGLYQIIVEDKAGNSRSYQFSVKVGTPLDMKRVVIISAVVLAVVAAAALYWRRNMRVL